MLAKLQPPQEILKAFKDLKVDQRIISLFDQYMVITYNKINELEQRIEALEGGS